MIIPSAGSCGSHVDLVLRLLETWYELVLLQVESELPVTSRLAKGRGWSAVGKLPVITSLFLLRFWIK
uniref:Uncharacterized protein n=1 Tax=Physcomitrium patens TaxID=3218 RepID=A0A2K1JUT0_PHYPA|nr:hypothetical protein PHYPA_015051 [Physcomitrium patens]